MGRNRKKRGKFGVCSHPLACVFDLSPVLRLRESANFKHLQGQLQTALAVEGNLHSKQYNDSFLSSFIQYRCAK
jgi:hypothetical protein